MSTAKPKKKIRAKYDPYVNSKDVLALDHHIFQDFLNDREVALVMFYDPEEPECDWSKKHFIRAAKTTERENHAFAAVNCVKEQAICADEGSTGVYPFFKLYSRGNLIDTYRDHRSFIHFTMRKFVENAPIIPDREPPLNPCTQKPYEEP
ncbi:unnamed protein product [Candidula unifasciata]|uniref:Thioredoxin domain-containing protein n=1 Tax=Candidula unifasciata TaxID=100452 RepID=A0A8S3YJB0_9EUPU|nr:unnamed protein product [Candidula unifasciata]